MSNNFQQKRKNFFNKLGYPADMSLRERGVRLIENGANLIFDTFTDKTPEYIPTTEPTNFQTSIKQMSMYPKFQSSSEYIQQSLNRNELNKQERINAYKLGKKIYINLADKEDTGYTAPPRSLPTFIFLISKVKSATHCFNLIFSATRRCSFCVAFPKSNTFSAFDKNLSRSL